MDDEEITKHNEEIMKLERIRIMERNNLTEYKSELHLQTRGKVYSRKKYRARPEMNYDRPTNKLVKPVRHSKGGIIR